MINDTFLSASHFFIFCYPGFLKNLSARMCQNKPKFCVAFKTLLTFEQTIFERFSDTDQLPRYVTPKGTRINTIFLSAFLAKHQEK